jgi:hypothetical protein
MVVGDKGTVLGTFCLGKSGPNTAIVDGINILNYLTIT